jgi:hypothetical protein
MARAQASPKISPIPTNYSCSFSPLAISCVLPDIIFWQYCYEIAIIFCGFFSGTTLVSANMVLE